MRKEFQLGIEKKIHLTKTVNNSPPFALYTFPFKSSAMD